MGAKSEEVILVPRVTNTEASEISREMELDLMDLFVWHQNELMKTLEGAVKKNSIEDLIQFVNDI